MREQGASGARPWLAGVVVLAACVWVIDLGVLGAGAPHPLDDTWEYGVAAREVLAGHGFRTAVIHPPLWSLRDARLTVPVLVHGPVLPLLLAPLLWAAGPVALERIAWLAALFATLTAVALFRLGERRSGPAAGAAAAGVWTLSPPVLHAVHHDPALPIGAFLLTLALERLLDTRPRGLAAGAALGLGCLVRPEMLLATPVLLVLARGARWRFGLALIVCLAPWAWHNLRATGGPFFNLSSYMLIGYSKRWPEISVLRDFALPPRAFPAALLRSLPSLPEKWLDFLPHALKRALLAPTAWTGWLVLFGAATGLSKSGDRRLAACAIALALIPVGIMTATVYDDRYLTPFLPLWSLGVALGAETLAALLPGPARRPRVWMWAVVLLLAPHFVGAVFTDWREGREVRRTLSSARAALVGRFGPPEIPPRPLFSDAPDFVAWTTGRPTVWLSRAEYERLPRCERRGTRDDAPDHASRGAPPPCRAGGQETWFLPAK